MWEAFSPNVICKIKNLEMEQKLVQKSQIYIILQFLLKRSKLKYWIIRYAWVMDSDVKHNTQLLWGGGGGGEQNCFRNMVWKKLKASDKLCGMRESIS